MKEVRELIFSANKLRHPVSVNRLNCKSHNNSPFNKGSVISGLKFAIEDTFHRNVDLLQESTPKNPYFIKELQETKQLIYEQ